MLDLLSFFFVDSMKMPKHVEVILLMNCVL